MIYGFFYRWTTLQGDVSWRCCTFPQHQDRKDSKKKLLLPLKVVTHQEVEAWGVCIALACDSTFFIEEDCMTNRGYWDTSNFQDIWLAWHVLCYFLPNWPIVMRPSSLVLPTSLICSKPSEELSNVITLIDLFLTIFDCSINTTLSNLNCPVHWFIPKHFQKDLEFAEICSCLIPLWLLFCLSLV